MQADFDDLIFYDQPVYGGGNLIDFEIETYNATTATVWLNITTLPTTGKTVSMYYGNAAASSTQNPTDVWDGDFVGVWHMSDDIGDEYAWNNYKDPDGVITANSSQNYILAEPSVLYEDNKFKMRMRERYASGVDYLGYWESTDGYNWIQIATDLLGSNGTSANRCRHSFVMKDPNSSGYWCYNMNESTSKEDLYYGTNETDWAIDTRGVFSASDVGGASMIGNVFVWRENTSDWYAIVENNGPTWTSDYATSNDGKSWTFHGQVTVSGFGSNSLSGPNIHKNNGTYYMWFHGNKNNDGGIPSDTYVATCTDRQSWVYQPGFEITREYDWEGVDNSGGQLADPSFAEKDGELYIFYQSAYNQAPSESTPQTIGLVHLNESLQEVCDHIDAGLSNVASDSTSNGRDGALTDITSSTDGVTGNCMVFDGDSSYIDFGTPSTLPDATHEYWVNASAITGTTQIPYVHNIATGGTPILRQQFFENSSVDKMVAMVGIAFSDEITASPNQYYYITIVSNSTGNDLWYVNGEQIDSKTHSTIYAGDKSAWRFGAGRSKTNWFGGKIDEGRVSDVVRTSDWINLSYQMVVDNTYVTFGAEQTYGADTNDIVLGANKYGMLRKDVSSAQTFSTIADGFTHDVCFTWWDDVSDTWKSYWVGDSYNSGQSIPKDESYFVLMDSIGETVSCSVASAATVSIPYGWSVTYLRESDAKTLSAIKADMGGNCADLYAWDHTASGTGAWTNTGSYTVLPNQGLLVRASSSFNWDGSVS